MQRPCAHWLVEKKLYRMFDINFGEDDCMVKKAKAQEDTHVIRRVVIKTIKSVARQQYFTKKLSKR
jgi:hypothetical protein